MWPVVVGAAAVLPLLTALPAGTTLAWRDTAILFAPMRPLVATALRSFRLPLWNPWEGAGQPLFAGLAHSVLHPVSVAAAFLDLGTTGYLLGYVAFAAAGAFVAARSLGLTHSAAAGSAFAYALSGYVLGMTCNAVYLAGASSSPWIVAGMLQAALHGRTGLAFAAAAVACGVFSGEPQALAVGGIIGATCAFMCAGVFGLMRALAGALVGLALSAVQILPTLALFSESARRSGVSARASDAQWPLDPARLVELVSPGFYVGRITSWDAPVFAAFGTPAERPIPWTPSIFVGVAVLTFAAVAARRSREGRGLVFLALFFAWLAMGHRVGASQLFSGVPIWSSFRYAEKLVGPMTLCLALAAGVGIDHARKDRLLARLSAPAAAATAAAWFLLLLLPAGEGAAFGLARQHLVAGLAQAALAALALAGLAAGSARLDHWFPAEAAALLYVEALAAAPYALHVGRASVESSCPPALQGAPAGTRIQTVAVSNALPVPTRLDPIDALTQKWARLGVPSLNARCGVETLQPYTSFETLRTYYTVLATPSRIRAGSRFGATHVLSEPPSTREDAALLSIAIRGGAPSPASSPDRLIWEVPHRPWASFAPALRGASGIEQAVALAGAAVARDDPTVIVESPAGLTAGPGRVFRSEKGTEWLRIEAETDTGGVLVVNDSWDPGWVARIDGSPVAVHPADVLVRAVAFPAGRHVLEMHFEPREVKIGGAVSGLTLLLLIAFCVLPRRRPEPA